MANEEHLAILAKGVAAWNSWRNENPGIQANLTRANLRKASLTRANLGKAILTEADLGGAELYQADLHEADLRKARLLLARSFEGDFKGANLDEADLTLADLTGATLCGATFIGALLNGTNLSSARLTNANFTRSDVGLVTFGDVDLRSVRGLDQIRHLTPSTIGIDTIYRFGGNIPEVFLRGCGVPDTFIEFMASLVGKAIEFYSCFISYSTKNQDFADRLYADLQAKGVRCWFAPEDLQGSKKVHEQLEESVRLYDKLLVVLSEHSMASEWVKTEIYKLGLKWKSGIFVINDKLTQDLLDQQGQVWAIEAQSRCRSAVMLDIWWSMLMVGVGAGKRRIVWMRLWVIPVQFLVGAPDFVAVALDKYGTTVPG